MAICKFYLNGTCRYGDDCRFEHVDRGGGDRYGNDRLKWINPNLQRQPQPQQTNLASGFSFNRAAQNLHSHEPVSVFSFNRAASQLCDAQSQSNFSNFQPSRSVVSHPTSHGPSSFFSNQPQQQHPSFQPSRAFAAPATGGFSFNQALKHLQPQPQQRSGLVAYDDVIDEEMSAVPQQTSHFSQQSSQRSFFSAQPSSASSGQMSSFAFGNAASGQSNSTEVIAKKLASSNVYSQLDRLEEDDRRAFEANQFVDRIPLCPPPRQLCF